MSWSRWSLWATRAAGEAEEGTRTVRRCLLAAVVGIACLAAGPGPAVGRAAAAGHWESLGLAGTQVQSLAVGRRHPDLILAGAQTGMYRRERGHDWKQVLRTGSVASIDLLADDRTVVAGDNLGYVDISADAGDHWRRALLTPRGIYAVSVQPGDARHILAGADGAIYLSRDGGSHWSHRFSLRDSFVTSIAWKPGSSHTVFAGTGIDGGPHGSARILISRDGGSSWHVFDATLNTGGVVMSLLVTRDYVFAGTMGNAVWRSPLGKVQWQQVANGMPTVNDHDAGFAAVPGRAGTVYVGTVGYGVFRTQDAGEHWTSVSDGLPADRHANVVLALAYSPARRVLYAGTDDGVYQLAPA